MSVLAPLYLLGLLAISLPIVFHLIRRSPRGELAFSSTMFLAPSPPRLTRRSRLDNLLLLLLRGLALTLLAIAFARPFLREAALLAQTDVGHERVAVLIDTSASMRRGDLWQQVLKKADEIVARCRPQDELAVFAFDDRLHPIATYEDLARVEPARRRAAVKARLDALEPTWAGTQLGQGLAEALVEISETQEDGDEQGFAPRRVVLISDLQQGSHLAALGEQSWPTNVRLELATLSPPDPTNAGLERLADVSVTEQSEREDEAKLRVRVVNAAGSDVDQFRLTWTDSAGGTFGTPLDVYTPSGESRVTRVPLPPAGVAEPRLVLSGDAHEFDNTLYFLPTEQPELLVLYLGAEAANDPEGMRYYFARALESDPSRSINFMDAGPDDAELPKLIVVTTPSDVDQAKRLRDHVSGGAALLYVVTAPADTDALAELLGDDNVEVAEAEVDGYTMLGQIEFDHALFAPMAGPQFNDFTQIRFWKYRRLGDLDLADANVIARFENGDPAVLERRLGAGRIIVLTSGWHPADSQLSRSWKFLLMLSSLIESDLEARSFESGYVVNDSVELPTGVELAESAKVTKPDGAEVLLANDARRFNATDQPGVYMLNTVDGPLSFVVGLDPAESDTEPLAAEAFEQLGCRLTDELDAERELERMQQLRDVELESRQKIWKALVALALVVLIIETVLAGWYSRPHAAEIAAA